MNIDTSCFLERDYLKQLGNFEGADPSWAANRIKLAQPGCEGADPDLGSQWDDTCPAW